MEKSDLYDHYKDSFEQTKSLISKRDKLTIYLLVIMVFMCFHLNFQDEIETAVDTAIQSQIKGLKLSFGIINSLVVLLYLWIMIQYFQATLSVRVSYKYIQKLEKQLVISREGKHYKQYRTCFNYICRYFYEYGLPFAFIVFSVWKGYKEWMCSNGFAMWLNIVVLLLSIAVCLTYMYSMYKFPGSENVSNR